MQVNYKYAIEDKVLIKAINTQGVVTSMMTNKNGQEYFVVYWDDGLRQSVWVYDWEISKGE